jgi:ribosome biogenesis SPOUT family RNA methylase Rps3
MSERETLRVPVSQAASKGISWLSGLAEEYRVILTKFGNPTVVIESAEEADEVLRTVTEARREVVENFADAAVSRSARFSLEEVCARLDIDPERVRQRVQEQPVTLADA